MNRGLLSIERASSVLGAVEKRLLAIAVGTTFLLVLFITSDVILRRLFNKPILGSYEASELGLAVLVFLSLGYVTHVKGHITVELLVSRFSPRAQALLDCFSYLIGLILFSLVTWQAIKTGIFMWQINELTPHLFIPKYPFRLLLALGAFFVCLELILQFIETVRNGARRRGLES